MVVFVDRLPDLDVWLSLPPSPPSPKPLSLWIPCLNLDAAAAAAVDGVITLTERLRPRRLNT